MILDHHCLFLGVCIGRNNYRWFVLTVVWIIWGCLYLWVLSAFVTYQTYDKFTWPLEWKMNKLTKAKRFRGQHQSRTAS
eukprot:UN33131